MKRKKEKQQGEKQDKIPIKIKLKDKPFSMNEFASLEDREIFNQD